MGTVCTKSHWCDSQTEWQGEMEILFGNKESSRHSFKGLLSQGSYREWGVVVGAELLKRNHQNCGHRPPTNHQNCVIPTSYVDKMTSEELIKHPPIITHWIARLCISSPYPFWECRKHSGHRAVRFKVITLLRKTGYVLKFIRLLR